MKEKICLSSATVISKYSTVKSKRSNFMVKALSKCLISCFLSLGCIVAKPVTGYASLTLDKQETPSFVISYRGKPCAILPLSRIAEEERIYSCASNESEVFNANDQPMISQEFTKCKVLGKGWKTVGFSYAPDFKLSNDLGVYAVSPKGLIHEGQLSISSGLGSDYRSSMGPARFRVLFKLPYDFKKGSPPAGTPVFIKGNDQLIGIVSYNHDSRSPYLHRDPLNSFVFETLCLPPEKPFRISEAKKTQIYGVNFKKAIEESELRWIFPSDIWDVNNANTSDFSKDYMKGVRMIGPDTPLLYRFNLNKKNQEGNSESELHLTGHSVREAGVYRKAEKLVYLLEKAYGKPNLMSPRPKVERSKEGFSLLWLVEGRAICLLVNFHASLGIQLIISTDDKIEKFEKSGAMNVLKPFDFDNSYEAYFFWLNHRFPKSVRSQKN